MEPLSSITDSELLADLCLYTHDCLWLHAIEHDGISLSSLMYDRATGKGVLMDHETQKLQYPPAGSGLAPVYGPRSLRIHRLLLYVICESFAWVLVWICSVFENGVAIESRLAPVKPRTSLDSKRAAFKANIISFLADCEITPTKSFKERWKDVFCFLRRSQAAQREIELPMQEIFANLKAASIPELNSANIVAFNYFPGRRAGVLQLQPFASAPLACRITQGGPW
ncbi:hypothetical protein FB451DRAFT_1555163 [Mycena latifolia]|nr:hypothetical protein FB451DRAFT_1555163 [Mycena latifolia]